MPQGRTPFEQIALLLQGGGALGAYQAGVSMKRSPRPICIPIGLPEYRSAPSIRRSLPVMRQSCASMRCAHFGTRSLLRPSAFLIFSSSNMTKPSTGQSGARPRRPVVRRAEFFRAALAAALGLAAGQS